MLPFKLNYPVHAIDKTQLLPAGSLLTPEKLNEVIAAVQKTPIVKIPFLSHGSIKKDLSHFINLLPYRIIFENIKKTNKFFDLIKTLQFPLPLFKMLDYFQEYDFYTYRHMLIVFAMSTLLAQELLEESQNQFKGTILGPTHDFGKICIPLTILKKTTPLTLEERQILEHHALAGFVLLTYYFQDKDIPDIIIARDHHERRNGSGYPRGMHVKDKMTEIVIATDIFDALVSPRPYRKIFYDNRTALEEITLMAEIGELDWQVVQALVGLNRKGHIHYSECSVSLEKRGEPPMENFYGVCSS